MCIRDRSKAGTEAAIGSGEVSELLAKARKAIGTRNVLRGPQAPQSNGNLPANIVDKNNWDKNMKVADSYFQMCIRDRPSVVIMNTPQVFQGISADVTVPAPSSAFDNVLG